MKLNFIKKYQQGGVYSPPFAVYQPIPSASQRTAASGSSQAASQSSSKDLTDKDLLTMLEKLDGLPSDMALITSSLQNFYIDNTRPGVAGRSTSNIAVRYLGILNQMKVANFNKKEYDNAFSLVSKNGGINEVAVNERGQFVCRNEKGDFKLMTADQLRESAGEYAAMTNSELLYYRAQDPTLANNNQILSVVQNGIGIEVVTKMIQDSIASLGSSETAQEGYLSTKKGRVIQGLQDFEQAVQEASGTVGYDGTVNDLYKYKFLTKDQASQAAEAMLYIYNTLPANAKALLKAKSDLTDEGAQKLVQTLIASKLDNKQQFDIDLAGGVSAKSSKEAAASGKDNTNLKASQLVDMVKSIEGVKQQMVIDRGDGIQMSVFGRQFNLITDTSGKPIENTSLSSMLTQSGIQGIVKNMQNITFGDQKVSSEALKNITYNNTGVMRVNLPINPDGSVNLSLMGAYQQAEAKLEALGRTPTQQDIQDAYESSGLSSLLKADGTPDETKFGAFLVTEGYTTDALSGVKPSEFVKEYKGDVDKAVEILQQSLKVGTGKDASLPDIDTYTWFNPADWFGNYDTIYKAAIYIPIDNSTLTAARLDGQKIDYDEAMGLEQKYQNFDKQSRFRQTSEDLLKND